MTVDAQAASDQERAERDAAVQAERLAREQLAYWRRGYEDERRRADALAARLEAAETALRTEFFRLLPDLDYESEDGVWAWEQHPWFSLLGVEYDDCVAALAAGREGT